MSITELPIEGAAAAATSAAAIAAADPALLDALFREHSHALRRLCRARLGNDRDADDAAQETLLRAWAAYDRFDESRPQWPWLAAIAGNVCIDLQRRNRSADARRAPSDLAPASPEDVALDGDRGELLRCALGQLAPSSQRLLYLREVEGWSYSRLSRLDGRSPGAIRTAVTRARNQLRHHVEATARATGRWPLSALLGVLWARGRARRERSRALVAELTARSVQVVDPTTGWASVLSGSTTAQMACGALLAAVVGVGAAQAPTVPERSPARVDAVVVEVPAHAPPHATSRPGPDLANASSGDVDPVSPLTGLAAPEVALPWEPVPSEEALATAIAPDGADAPEVLPGLSLNVLLPALLPSPPEPSLP